MYSTEFNIYIFYKFVFKKRAKGAKKDPGIADLWPSALSL
jgi:hypothetical protein